MADSQSTPVGTVYDRVVSILNAQDALPQLLAVELGALITETADRTALHPEVLSIVAALESKGIRVVALAGAGADPGSAGTRLAALGALGLDKVARESVALHKALSDQATTDLSSVARQLRSQTGIPGSSTALVCTSAAGAKAARISGVRASAVAAASRGLELAVLERLLGSFASAQVEERGF